MKIYKKQIFTLITGILISSFSLGCSEKEFEPPNKKEVVNGTADKLVSSVTALTSVKYGDKMAKVWDTEAVLMGINGSNIGLDGYNKPNSNTSKWILTYFSKKRKPFENAYTITFSGSGSITWLQGQGSYDENNNVVGFKINSDTAINSADKAGLPKGVLYAMELSKNSKGMVWVVGSKKEEKTEKYDLKKIDANSGEIIN